MQLQTAFVDSRINCCVVVRRYYSRSDTAELVDYAVKRGIRIVPEVDLPSHSSCFAPLIPLGMEFCDSSNQLLCVRARDDISVWRVTLHAVSVAHSKNTPTNVALLEKAIAGVMDAFPFSQIFHTGGDETVTHSHDAPLATMGVVLTASCFCSTGATRRLHVG